MDFESFNPLYRKLHGNRTIHFTIICYGSIQMISEYIICYYFEYKKQDYSAVLIGQDKTRHINFLFAFIVHPIGMNYTCK